MLKSRNDLYRQVERIVAMVDERGGWRKVHPGWHLDEQSLHQVAGSIAAHRGLSVFGDRDVRGEWRADMMYPYPQPRNTQPVVSHTHTCDECRFSTYDTNPLNLSVGERKPTLIICEIIKHPKIVVGSTACDKFRLKSDL